MQAADASSQPIFDYVIVGAGSAGCVMAEKLSRSGRYSVAIIEAGGSDRRFFVQMPLGYGKIFYDRKVNWFYRAEPDPGLNGQADFWPRGRIVGGSGSINAMVWIRGNAKDYDDWEAEGNAGWGYRDVLPVFKEIEDNEAGGDDWRGTGGPIHITDVTRLRHPLVDRFLKAGLQAGFPANRDFNGQNLEGMGIYQINTKDGWRMSSAKAYLYPAVKRANVTLFSKAMARRILFDGTRATGVEIEIGGKRRTLGAAREVVMCAGSINTPQLLQVSGVGPADHLRSLGIGIVCDSPAVGHHMQDHLGINYIYRSRVPTLNSDLRSVWGKLMAGINFMFRSAGPLALSLNQGGGFIRTRSDLERPNIQLYFQAISTLTARKGTRPLLRPDPFPGFAIGLANCRPKSRGSCLIRSSDPMKDPVIRPNAFGVQADLDDYLEGVKILRRLAAQASLTEIIDAELAPGPQTTSDMALIEDIRNRSGTVYHPVGTCRMGPDPASAVVDSALRVHGLKGLRIADASIFPSITSGNTNAPTIMVAAKAASLILAEG